MTSLSQRVVIKGYKLFRICYQMICYYAKWGTNVKTAPFKKKICKRKSKEPSLTVPVLPSLSPMQLQAELLSVRPIARHQETLPLWHPDFLSSVPWPWASQLLACWGRHGFSGNTGSLTTLPNSKAGCSFLSLLVAMLAKPDHCTLLSFGHGKHFFCVEVLLSRTTWRKTDWLNHSKITISIRTATWSMNYVLGLWCRNRTNIQKRPLGYHFCYFQF